jgi:hypothetical protein
MLFRTMNMHMSAYVTGLVRAAGPMRVLGPYAVIALIVPGGCLIAIVYWALRNRAALMSRLRQWRGLGGGVRPDRGPRLNRITGICESTHSWLDPQTFATPASAMVVLRAGRAAEQRQPLERRRGAEPCLPS